MEGKLPAKAPQGFPVPPGVKVTSKDADDITIVISGANGDKVLSFYRDLPPSAGYKITKDVSVAGTASIDFEGLGFTGNIAVASGETDVAIITFVNPDN